MLTNESMDLKIMDNPEDKIKLFDSDEEEADNDDDFKIRPQFQGPYGEQMLEMSSQLSKRFKLDERFLEDFEPESVENEDVEIAEEKNVEREKNIRILETVLGHEVPKSIERNKSKKRIIRFDPDDENASQLVKDSGTPIEKKKKPKKKKKVVEEKSEQTVPVSSERYTEVCSNLKEILNTATPFSFTQQFNHDIELVENFQNIDDESSYIVKENNLKKRDENERSIQYESSIKDTVPHPNSKHIIPKLKGTFCFFVKEKDPRLKEGIEFFKRPKPMDEIREEWQKRRESVLELFRRKKRSSQRSYATRVQSMQSKFAFRKQNYRK